VWMCEGRVEAQGSQEHRPPGGVAGSWLVGAAFPAGTRTLSESETAPPLKQRRALGSSAGLCVKL
jgi:hypothetical protein